MSAQNDTNTGTIGIKIADGAYYPILQEDGTGKKRLVLTTVKDNQASVQIDLYKGRGSEIADAVYIGSLVIEDIEPASGGEPEIELTVGLDGEGNLAATAGDKSTGDTQSLSISLESLDEMGIYDIPEFDLEEDYTADGGLSPEEETQLNDEYDEYRDDHAEAGQTPPPKRRNPFMLPLFVLLGLAVVLLAAFLLVRLFSGSEVPPLQAARSEEPVAEETPEPPAEPREAEGTDPDSAASAPDEDGAASTANSEASASDQSGPAIVEKAEPSVSAPQSDAEGIWYKIQRGDTLWDLSAGFYQDPFRFGRLADENDIADPDLIYAGRELYIPKPRR